MLDKIGKFLDIANALLQIWLYKITVSKEKREDVLKLAQEADKAIDERRYDDVVIIWSRMRNI